MIDLAALVADLDRQIVAEQAAIETTIREAKAAGQSVHDGYWKTLYRLTERRRVAAIAAEIQSDAARIDAPSAALAAGGDARAPWNGPTPGGART